MCNTDHQALLEAGREMLRQAAQAASNAAGGSSHSGGTSPLPKVIRNLGARLIAIGDGHLMIEMHGGMDHFGFYVYPEDFNEPHPYFIYGDHKILDGLWYCDDEYRWARDYDKVVEVRLKRNRKVKR